MDRVRRGEHDLSGVPDTLAEVLTAALDPEPENRPALDELLAWLRPQTTEASTAPPARLAPAPAALTMPYAAAPRGPVARDERTLVEDDEEWEETERFADPTRVLPSENWLDDWDDEPADARTEQWDEGPEEWADPWADAEPVRPRRAPFLERVRRGLLVTGLGAFTAVAVTAAPYVTAAVLLVLVWLMRSGSLAASAAGRRRELRGRRWYDGPLLLLGTPWDAVRSIPGTLLLVLWSLGVAAAGALICYAFATSAQVTLLVSGLLLAVALWSGPGGSRVRGPVRRVVVPLSRGAGSWLLALALVAAGTGLLAWQVASTGTSWAPAQQRPFAGVDAPGAPSELGRFRDLLGR